MAPTQRARCQQPDNKLSRLPAGASIKKRPLIRPSIASPFSNDASPKVVYVKHATPFMSAVRRVRGLLKQIDKRASQSANDTSSSSSSFKSMSAAAATKATRDGNDRILTAAKQGIAQSKKEPVIIKGSGRAIEKVLDLAAWFEQRQAEEGVRVCLATSSTTAIDDIEYDDGDGDADPDGDELPESRLRKASVLEGMFLEHRDLRKPRQHQILQNLLQDTICSSSNPC